MTEPERIALLLDDSCGVLAGPIAGKLHEAGLMVVPREPTDEDIERMAEMLFLAEYEQTSDPDWADDRHKYLARAAWRAIVEGT